jgi:hypothetical protein
MSDPELLPCPCCHQAPEFWEAPVHIGCGAYTSERYIVCLCGMRTASFKFCAEVLAKEALAEIWNRRTLRAKMEDSSH